MKKFMIIEVPKAWINMHGDKCHLLSIVKDGDENIVTFKRWRKHKQRWHYEAEEEWLVLDTLNRD